MGKYVWMVMVIAILSAMVLLTRKQNAEFNEYEVTGYLVGEKTGDSGLYRWKVCIGTASISGRLRDFCPNELYGIQTNSTKLVWNGHEVAGYVLDQMTGPRKLTKIYMKMLTNDKFVGRPLWEVVKISATDTLN